MNKSPVSVSEPLREGERERETEEACTRICICTTYGNSGILPPIDTGGSVVL